MSSGTRSSKRAANTTNTPTTEPETKRTKTSDSPPEQYVYIVTHEISLGYNQGDSTSVAGVFSTIEDATNGIKRIVSEEYEGLATEDEDTVEITERNGSEKQREWGQDSAAGSGVEGGEEGEE